MFRIDDLQNDPNWYPSLGEKLDMFHYRKGHLHAECDPYTGYCSTHYDEHDPNESISTLFKHMWNSNLGRLVLVGTGALLLKELLKSEGQ